MRVIKVARGLPQRQCWCCTHCLLVVSVGEAWASGVTFATEGVKINKYIDNVEHGRVVSA